MFERGRATSYSACGIPYWISGAVDSEADLIARTPEQHRAMGIDVRMRTEVVGIDLDRRVVHWRDLADGGSRPPPVPHLVVAPGSAPLPPPGPPPRRAGVHGVPPPAAGAALPSALHGGAVLP